MMKAHNVVQDRDKGICLGNLTKNKSGGIGTCENRTIKQCNTE